jgi:hypothetical protein
MGSFKNRILGGWWDTSTRSDLSKFGILTNQSFIVMEFTPGVFRLSFYQCPLEGGNAVHRARAMLRGIGEYNFEGVNCVSTQALRGQNSNSTQANDDKLANTPAAVDPAVWRIYPNPASNYLRITGNHLEELHSVNLYDLSGKLQQTWSGGNSGNDYQLSDNLSSGIYILRLHLADGTQVNRKLVINK